MKISRLGWMLGLAILFTGGRVMAAGSFEGEVDMKVNRMNTNDHVIKYFVKGHKGRFQMDSNDGKFSGSGIYDWQTNQTIMIMDKQKMYMVSQVHPEKFHYGNDKHFKITKTGNSENILGYNCKEWDYTSDDGNGKIWFASGIGNWWANEMAAQADKLPSDQRALVETAIEQKLFPMKWETTDKSNSHRGSGEVVKIERQSLEDSFFEPPAGYKKFDMGNLFGGGASNQSGGQDSSQNKDLLSGVKPKLPF
jgi:hypothetical protein